MPDRDLPTPASAPRRNHLLLLVGASVLLLVGNTALAAWKLAQLSAASTWVAHTHEVLEELQQLLASLQDAETGQRGFLVSGEPEYLEPYQAGLRSYRTHRERLRELTRDNAAQQRRLEAMRPVIERKLAELARTVELRRQGDAGFVAARAVVIGNEGKALMDDLRAQVAAMSNEERRLLAERSAGFEAQLRTAAASAAVGLLASLAAVGWAFQSFSARHRQQVRATEELAEGAERLHTTLTSIGDAVIVADHAGRVTLMNAVAEELTGWSADEAVGQPVPTVFHIISEETRREVESPVARVLREGIVVGLANHTALVARDGRERPIADSGAPIRGAHGQIAGVVLVFRDQTEERRTEDALRSSERRYRAIFEQAAVGVTEVETATGRFLRVNERTCELLGYSREELLARRWQDVTHPEDRGADESGIRQLAATGTPYAREKRYLRRDGKVIWASLTVSPLQVQGSTPTSQISIIADLTERNALRQQFQQSQKLESVGRLAGGIAHDFNNLLTVILSCSSSLREALERGPSPLAEEAREIEGAAVRAAELTRQLLAFARKQIVDPVPLDLGKIALDNERMLRRLLGEDVDLRVERQPDLWTISADAGQVTQVIVNLAVNARDAMPEGGALAISTVNVTTTAEMAARDPDLVPGDWVRLVVRDTGMGMSAETRAHLFEPFFTTKEQGKGTGLGLATVYGIVRQAGGHIHVHSAPGQGTTFDVCFPRIQAAPSVPGPAAGIPEPTGTERVLVVEDDPRVRSVTVRTLQGAGYDVVAASHPHEALALAGELLGHVRLLITDVVMPALDGRLLAQELRGRCPALRVLFVSGYTPDAIAERSSTGLDGDFLEKPFTRPGLLAKVRAVLDGT